MKRALALTILSVALALLGIAVACGSNPITVATINVGAKCELADGGNAGGTCPPGQFCSRTSCLSNDGVCETIGADGCETSGPQCGCDNISYYNACLRQAAHVSRLSDAACDPGTALKCGPQISCPVDGASCATISAFPLPSVNSGPDGGFDLPDGGGLFDLRDGGPFDLPDGGLFDFREAGALFQMFQTYCLSTEQALERVVPRTCWVVPDSCPSPANRTVVGCDLQCIDECSAIRDGGFYFLCTPDASAN